jgi:osmotically-inducible protein OsmY
MITDAQIQKDVMTELKLTPFLNATEIGVAVKNGIVTLSGNVNSYAKKMAAEKAATKIRGVKAVAEEIEVVYPNSDKKPDAEIAAAILYTIKWNAYIPDDKIKVKVEDGWVTLEGEVEWEFQRGSAKRVVGEVAGVRGINDLLTLKPKATLTEIKKKIQDAFQRSATLDSDKIKIEIIGSKVILSGKIRSWAEKKDAGNAVWLMPGVTTVDNRLEVDSSVYAF